jgi:ribosomal protein S20
MPQAQKAIDMAAKKNIIHKNTASRRKSRLANMMPKKG